LIPFLSQEPAYDSVARPQAFAARFLLLIAIENVIDDAHRENACGLLMSLNMLIEFGDASDYTGADFQAWCRQMGSRRFDLIPLAGPSAAA
jgi:hypothetical protein